MRRLTHTPAGHGLKLGGHARSLRGAHPMEQLVRLPQLGFPVRALAGGQVTAGQAGYGVRLIPGALDLPGQAEGRAVTPHGPGQVAPHAA
jgi:hypothetical protein